MTTKRWRCDVVVNELVTINEVTLCPAWLVQANILEEVLKFCVKNIGNPNAPFWQRYAKGVLIQILGLRHLFRVLQGAY